MSDDLRIDGSKDMGAIGACHVGPGRPVEWGVALPPAAVTEAADGPSGT